MTAATPEPTHEAPAAAAGAEQAPVTWEQRERYMTQLMERQTLAMESVAGSLESVAGSVQGLVAVQQMPQLLAQVRHVAVMIFDPESPATPAQKAEAGQILAQILSLPPQWFPLPQPPQDPPPAAPRHLAIVPEDAAPPEDGPPLSEQAGTRGN